MKEITIYRSFDGVDFTNRIDCVEHELHLQSCKGVVFYNDKFMPVNGDLEEIKKCSFLKITDAIDARKTLQYLEKATQEEFIFDKLIVYGHCYKKDEKTKHFVDLSELYLRVNALLCKMDAEVLDAV